jgi:hypothetical protein
MAGGLSARQVSVLLKKHGSYDAAIEACPDLTDDLRAAQRWSEQQRKQLKPVADAAARIAATVSMPRELFAKPPKPYPHKGTAKARFERDVRVYETALDRHARRQIKRATPGGKKPREYTTQEFPRAMFIKAIRLLGDGAPITSRKRGVGIDKQTGLDRHLVSKIRDYTLSRAYEARPGKSPDTVVLVRVSRGFIEPIS